MKFTFSFLAILFFAIFQSQKLQYFVIPKGYEKILETRGDLDNDKIEEYVYVFKTNKKITSNFQNGFTREFFILKKINNQLKVWKKNNSILFADNTGFYAEYNSLPEIKIEKGVLKITQSYNTNSKHLQTYTDIFRFQKNDFYLIGSINKFDDTCEFNILQEINFSTNNVIVDEQYYPCFDGEKKPAKNFHKEFKYNFKPIKMDSFKVGNSSFKIPKTDKYFNF